MKKLVVGFLAAAFLAGCATFSPAVVKQHPRPQHHVVRAQDRVPAAVVVHPPAAPEPVPAPEPKPPTFAERFRETFAKIQWIH